jgi:hypothetical protein
MSESTDEFLIHEINEFRKPFNVPHLNKYPIDTRSCLITFYTLHRRRTQLFSQIIQHELIAMCEATIIYHLFSINEICKIVDEMLKHSVGFQHIKQKKIIIKKD